MTKYNWENNQGEQQSVSTEFNSSLMRLQSLNKLLDRCGLYSKLSRYEGYDITYLKLWRAEVVCLTREVVPKCSPKERKFIYSKFKGFHKIGQIIQTRRTEEGPVSEIDPHKFNLHWNLLNRIETVLRILADKHGMLLTNKDNYEDMMGEMY